MSDTKALRRYQAGVERALGLFDASNEWADYIAFLSRLLKALQAAPPGADVPSKANLAKYLAQCLRPSLPAGVHQKALEVYGVIFTLLGKDGLSRDLSLYLPGVSHTLAFASLSVRPWFLALYDEHLLKLPSSTLRPALKAIILSLLPGIEEEQSEDFEKTLSTLTRLRAIFSSDQTEDIFWQSIFLASITSPNRRMGVLMYLSRYLPKLGQPETPANGVDHNTIPNGAHASISAVTSPEPGLLIRCFSTGLQDDQPLVQRGFLDLLVSHIPLKAETLQRNGSADDLGILVSAAMSIVLKRDMSLNRRLWAWFLSSDEKSSASDDIKSPGIERTNSMIDVRGDLATPKSSGAQYFSDFGLAPIIQTFEKMLRRKLSTPSQRARTFRILTSLLDRSAIGVPVVEALFEPMIQDLRTYQSNAPSQEAFDEVFRSANVFFDSIEPRAITYHLLKLLEKDNLELVDFICGNFSLDDDEMVRQHLPTIVFVLSNHLLNPRVHQPKSSATPSTPYGEQVASLMDTMLPVGPSLSVEPSKSLNGARDSADATVTAVYQYYGAAIGASNKPAAVPADVLVGRLLYNVSQAITQNLHKASSQVTLDHLTLVFERLCSRSPTEKQTVALEFSRYLAQWAHEKLTNTAVPFTVSRNVTKLVAALLAQDPHSPTEQNPDLLNVVPILTQDFWQRLSPSRPQHHMESVDVIWTLRSLTSTLYLVDSTIISLLSKSHNGSRDQQHPVTNFAIFWAHTRLPSSSALAPVSLETPASEAEATTFLKTILLYILDIASPENGNDPCRLWLSSLPSLNLHFQAILEIVQNSGGSPQEITTCLHRLLKLIRIAKGSAPLWADFDDQKGFLLPVLNLATSVVVSSPDQDDWVQTALKILRLIHEGSDTMFNAALVETLTQQISRTPNGSTLQSSIIDTIQLLVAIRGADSPPSLLMNTLMAGISSPAIDTNIDKWITLLCNAIPLYPDSVFFSNLLKLTECFCKRTQDYFAALISMYDDQSATQSPANIQELNILHNPERSITNLLSGLEYILARAHTKVSEAARPPSSKQDNSNEVGRSRAQANNRLTAILCMQDAIKVCGQVWFWRPAKKSPSSISDSKSFNYMSSRLRSRTRRMLEHLINAEPQECLETLMGMWVNAVKKTSHQMLVMNLLESLDGARPKFMMPAIFNAIYGRTNPGALDVDQRSSLSVDVTGLELVAFLTDYVNALEDDLLEEIWSDCTSFLRDILANPMPHRQILLRLLELLSLLCQKMENTNFGDQIRMRRELADLCARLFTAIFTIKPGGFDQSSGRLSPRVGHPSTPTSSMERFKGGNGIEILCHVLPSMSPVLMEADRITSIYAGISANITGPLLRSRTFPAKIGGDVVDLLFVMSKAQTATKTWRKDILEAFNDPKLFQSDSSVAESGWVPIIKQLTLLDKGLLSEVLSRLTQPATAGIMFGVGAAAARAEADKQAKINLRRVSMMLIANEKDTFISSLAQIMVKVEELLTATPASSPSSTTRGEVFLLLRAISLSYSQNHLVSLWPVMDSELRVIFEDISKSAQSTFTSYSHLQAAKLLDVLLLLKPEEFQLHEWLYITDTIDAIYPPVSSRPIALADNLSLIASDGVDLQSITVEGNRKPWLCTDLSRSAGDYSRLLGSFFGHLSIRAFEDTYSLEPVDETACRRDILNDLFTDGD